MLTLSKAQLQTAVLEALQSWSNLNGNETNLLTDLLLVRQARQIIGSDMPPAQRLATNQVLFEAIEALKKQDQTSAQILSQRFIDNETILMVAHRHGLSEDQVKRRQRLAIRSLAQIIEEQEEKLRREHAESLLRQLPPAGYDQLFGMQPAKAELVQKVSQPDAPWIVSVVGLGGIGKTSLVDTAVRQMIEQHAFDDVLWVRDEPDADPDHAPEATWSRLVAKLTEHFCPDAQENIPLQQQAAQLRHTLRHRQALIVIDNLERNSDVAYLSEQLLAFVNPSKFLLTSRVRLPASGSVFSLFLPELPMADCLQLIRHQAVASGLEELATAGDEVLQQILKVTGGNPLAIKLVVGLATVLPLPEILVDLVEAKSLEIEQMYRNIYWAAWRMLSENAQLLLEMMPMAAGVGAKPEQLMAVSGLEKGQLWPAITELVNRSLLEVRGTIWERRYGIHQLTDSFLRTEIIHWPKT